MRGEEAGRFCKEVGVSIVAADSLHSAVDTLTDYTPHLLEFN